MVLLASCGTDNSAEAPSCVPKAGVTAFDEVGEVELDIACDLPAGEDMTIQFVPGPNGEAGRCDFLIIGATGPDFPTPVVNINFLIGDSAFAGAGFSLRDYYFEDRLSFSNEFEGSDGEGTCAETSVELTELVCRASYEDEQPEVSCGNVILQGTDMFASFTDRTR